MPRFFAINDQCNYVSHEWYINCSLSLSNCISLLSPSCFHPLRSVLTIGMRGMYDRGGNGPEVGFDLVADTELTVGIAHPGTGSLGSSPAGDGHHSQEGGRVGLKSARNRADDVHRARSGAGRWK